MDQKPRLIRTINGAIFNANKIVCIARLELNEYLAILEDCSAQPKLTLDDIEWIEKNIGWETVEKSKPPVELITKV